MTEQALTDDERRQEVIQKITSYVNRLKLKGAEPMHIFSATALIMTRIITDSNLHERTKRIVFHELYQAQIDRLERMTTAQEKAGKT